MTDSKLIVPEKGLPLINGWASLSEAKKKWLQEKTTNIKSLGGAEVLSAAKQCLELLETKNGLKGEKMTITDYIETVFSFHPRTGWRRLQAAEEMAENWPPELIRAVAERGTKLLQGVAGIYMKDLVRVSRELPPPKELNDKTIDAFIEHKVRSHLKEERVERSKRRQKISLDDGIKICFNHDLRIIENIKGLDASKDRKEMIATYVGWLMHYFAMPGTIECRRITHPEDAKFKVGRPLKKTREKSA